MTGQVIRSSKATAVRYEREKPGELVHTDVKKLGKISDGGGWRARAEARTHQARLNKTPVGYDYVHRWSTTTPGWRAPRSCPTRRAPPARHPSNVPRRTSQSRTSPASSGS